MPLIFSTNYFLKKNEEYLNGMLDKKVWLMWMDGRVHSEFKAIETPVGFVPLFEDLKGMFKEFLGKEYTKKEYNEQFSIRAKKYLEKLDRIEAIFKEEDDIPDGFFMHLKQQKERLREAIEKFGEVIPPESFL